MVRRALEDLCFNDRFGRQMRFIAGPRQVGKTTLLRRHLAAAGRPQLYYNWDLRQVRERYKSDPHFFNADALAGGVPRGRVPVGFDEMHKYPRWKSVLKGCFDEYEEKFLFLVTGSARLDLFRKSGDALSGRYFLFRLLPVSLFELAGAALAVPEGGAASFVEASVHAPRQKELESLIRFGGYPEPLMKQDDVFSARWHEQYVDTLVRDDLRDLTRIHELENVATLLRLVPERVGAPFSVQSASEDMSVSYNAAKNYLRALVLSYVVFLVPPYSKRLARAVKKETKVYFFDWTQVREPGRRFENYVACELKHRAELWSLVTPHRFELHFVRMRDGKETDFLITRDAEPYLLIEAKAAAQDIEPHHLRHAERLGAIPVVQLTQAPNLMRAQAGRAYAISASRFF